ncbi:WD40-repeat-containing domain protein [Umbelopsis sp. PMI_123]|nr:WD40-repeat-containing domain protein [Umbelopsis sp. PMI_123]
MLLSCHPTTSAGCRTVSAIPVGTAPEVVVQIPVEIHVAIFRYLDGRSLTQSQQVCQHWYRIIHQYEELIWGSTAKTDFEFEGISRFWQLQMQHPRNFNDIGSFRALKRTWADSYRISTNWYSGNCHGYFPETIETNSMSKRPHAIVGIPQEGLFSTALNVVPGGQILRYNPIYRTPGSEGEEARNSTVAILQCPNSGKTSVLDSEPFAGISTLYTHPLLNYMVTGDIHGNVSLRDLSEQGDVITWTGHRGRVLCVSMNENVVVSGGSDCTLRVWDIDRLMPNRKNHSSHSTNWRGTIDISLYLSPSSEWFTGVGELAVNDNLIACSSDPSAPILIFSLLTGSLVYQLRSRFAGTGSMYSHLCMTPFFLLTKGKFLPNDNGPRIVQSMSNHSMDESRRKSQEQSKTRYGYVTQLNDSTINIPQQPNLTAYQLQQLLQLRNSPMGDDDEFLSEPDMRACINVWDLRTGKIIYRLVPDSSHENQRFTSFTDIRTTPDFSKVIAVLCNMTSGKEKVYVWDFSSHAGPSTSIDASEQEMFIEEIDNEPIKAYGPTYPRTGKAWLCYM